MQTMCFEFQFLTFKLKSNVTLVLSVIGLGPRDAVCIFFMLKCDFRI